MRSTLIRAFLALPFHSRQRSRSTSPTITAFAAVRAAFGRQSAGNLLQMVQSHSDMEPCVDDPVGSRASKRILTAVRLRSCVRPCRRGAKTAGPDEVRDPVPNNLAASRATGSNGICGSSVRPIAISLRSFTLASTRGSSDDQLKPAVLPRVIVAHADRAIPLFNQRPKPRGGSIARRSERSNSTIARKASAVAPSR